MDAATDAKSKVEDAQREEAKKREETGQHWTPRFFEQTKDGLWIAKIKYTSILIDRYWVSSLLICSRFHQAS
jgi:hypothetical protein